MAKVMAALLVLLGIAALTLFFVTGAGAPAASPSGVAQALGPAAGSPWLALGGGLGVAVGILLAGVAKDPAEPYAIREVVAALSLLSAAAFAAALLLGVARVWDRGTLAALALGGGAETLVGAGLSLRLLFARDRRGALFWPGALLSVALVAFYAALAVLGAA